MGGRGDGPTRRWTGRWIWAAAADWAPSSARSVVALRREVEVASVPDGVVARVFAVARYVLYVNGREVVRGPARTSPRAHVYDVVDLAPFLHVGVNAVGAIACCYDRPMPWWAPLPGRTTDLQRGGFVLDSSALVSDTTWGALALPGWTMAPSEGVSGRGREVMAMGDLPAGWSRAGLEAEWPAATERAVFSPGDGMIARPPVDPVGPHAARAVPPPPIRVVALQSVDDSVWTAGEVVAGSLRLDVEGPPGASISLQVAERVDTDGVPRPEEYESGVDLACDGSRRVVESLDSYGLSAALVTATGGAVVHAVAVVERNHPVMGDASFRCSDSRLDTVWQVGRRTVTLCSADAYVDCPTREQRAWTGDAVVHQMVDLATNADWSLARWHPRMSAAPRADGMLPVAVGGDLEHGATLTIPDWALHWIHSVWNLYRYVGDVEEVRALLPVAEGVLRWFERSCGPEGLPTDVPGSVLIDWASVYVDGASSALCGLWGRALLEFAEMSSWVGDQGRAAWSTQLHARAARGYELFWDPERGRYADVVTAAGRQPMASQHGQAAAIVGGLAPPERWARLVEVLTDTAALVDASFGVADGPSLPNSEAPVGGAFIALGRPPPWWDVDRQVVRAQPFFRYVVHDALATAGHADLIATACLDWVVALERCPTSWSETWYGGTTCHGWSSTPTRDLTVHVLGIGPAEPGFASAHIEPHLGHLDWVAGAAPTPAGLLRVEADRRQVVVDSPIAFVHQGRSHPPGRHTLRRAAPA